MNCDQVREHVRHWVDSTLSVPSPLFNNLPPCPYSREALLRNKVEIRCTTGAEVLSALVEAAGAWDDRYELILLACEPDTIAPEDLIAGVEGLRAGLEAGDLVVFFDHPRCTDPKYVVTSANGRYVFVGLQRLSLFLQAAKPLVKRNYFAQAHKQFDSIDRLPVEAIHDWQFARFTAHWKEVAANSPFHAERFRALGISPSDIRSWSDLRKLPALETKTLLERNLDFPAVPQSRRRRILVSGGTTGTPKIGFYADNLREILKEWAGVWQGAGLTPDDVAAVLCPIPLASGMLITEFLEEAGCTTLPVGLTTPPEFAARLMTQLKATMIVSQPSTVQHFAEQIRAFGYSPGDFTIRKMYLGSEVLTTSTRRNLESEWGCEIFDTSGSSETGMIGAECSEHDGHHLAVGSAYFEVLDQETRTPVTEGVGQLYITTLLNLGLPLIRYDMKDLVRVTNAPCRCGRTTPRIWFRGRADDRFVLKTGVKFFSYQLDAALEPFDAVTASYNVIATGDHQQDRIRLVIEAHDRAHQDADLKERISRAIVASSVDFSEIHAAGMVNDPEVEFVPIGSLPRTPRGKIMNRFQDRRGGIC